MNITISELEGKLVVAIEGDLNNGASAQATRDMAPVFERTDCDVVIDCTQLDYIASSGLRLILDVYKHTRANGRKAFLKNLSEDVKEVFSLSGFLQLFIVE